MGKKLKKIICIVFVSISLIACTTKKTDKETNENEKAVNIMASLSAIKELDDGWYGTITIVIPKNNMESESIKGNYDLKNIQSVHVNVINVKYQKLEGFYIPLKNKEGEETGKMTTVMPTFLQSPQYGDMMAEIGNFLANQKFAREIVVEDLKDLVIKGIAKEDIVFLYNQAISKVPDKKNDVFLNIKYFNMGMTTLKNGDKIQVGYVSNYTDIGVCNIEYILKDDTYLSDVVKQKKATEEQIAFQAKLDSIEDNLVKTQDINKIESLGTNEYDKALLRLMKSTLGVE